MSGSSASAPRLSDFVDFDGANAAAMVNNYDWTGELSTLDFLRDIGKHFPVNRMLDREVDQGPARGRHLLHRVLLRAAAVAGLPGAATAATGCTLQTGGSDQWGNITAGVELIRRAEGAKVHALGHAPADQGRRHEVRQDRVGHRLARPEHDAARTRSTSSS